MRLHVFATVALVACGAPKEPAASSFPAPTTASPSTTDAPRSESSRPDSPLATAGDADTFAKMRADLTACFEEGRKAVPSMTSGKITFHVSVDPGGRTACVVPSDDTGLTQDVENCMRARLDKETHPARDAPWSFAVPIRIDDGKLAPGEARTTPPTIETVESHGLAEDVYDVVDRLLPELYACVQGVPKSAEMRMLYVGARVGAGGQVECALASAPSSIPAEVRTCTSKVLGRAKFRAPKKGYGLLSIPLNIMSRR